MQTNYNRMLSDRDLPPSKRRQQVHNDIKQRQELASSYAQSLNRQNRIAEKQEKDKKSEALALLQSGDLPACDVIYYIAQSMGLSIEEYQEIKEEEFIRARDQLSRQYQRIAYKEVTARFEAEEQALIKKYSKEQ
ncbi:hypothetical protein [Vibrio fluvialis]|uniref:hypothetical protein n=1 Tax=Vibrio fluvialis TaxID=676 RepID=UPI001EEB449E|nr:hypothetical protein [Vibrio fluvialis]MCG6368731.1 hypothetical protein [Vibrio fluvialis]MCG6377432.1 hypothetical protein [Vibrio fluvialis]